MVLRPNARHGLLVLEVTRSQKKSHYIGYGSSGRVISPPQRPLPNNKRQLQETNIHDSGGIRTRNPRKRVAANPRLTLRGQWDRRSLATCMSLILTSPYHLRKKNLLLLYPSQYKMLKHEWQFQKRFIGQNLFHINGFQSHQINALKLIIYQKVN